MMNKIVIQSERTYICSDHASQTTLKNRKIEEKHLKM